MNTETMENTLINYIRNDDGTPYGVVVATRIGDNVHFGYSFQNPIDKWDRKKGLKIALSRAEAGSYEMPISSSKRFDALAFAYRELEKRAMKYFKEIPTQNKTL